MVTGATLNMRPARFYGGNPFASGCGIQVDMVRAGLARWLQGVHCRALCCIGGEALVGGFLPTPHPTLTRAPCLLIDCPVQSPAFNGNPILEVADFSASASVTKAATMVRCPSIHDTCSRAASSAHR